MKQNNSKKFMVLYEYRKKHGNNIPAECWVKKTTIHHINTEYDGNLQLSKAIKTKYSEVILEFCNGPAMVPVAYDTAGLYEMKFIHREDTKPIRSRWIDPEYAPKKNVVIKNA